MITLQDTTSELDFVIPEDFNDISEVILQENKKAMQRMQKEFDEVIKDKNKEIYRLKEHSQKILTRIKKSKVRKQCVQRLKQENQDLKKNLSEKDKENSHLKNLNHELLEQIRKLKEEKLKNPDIKAQEDANPVKEKTYRDVGVQTMEDPSKLTNQNPTINKAASLHEENHISKSKEENDTSMIRGNHVMRTPSRHSNHKSRYINQLESQYYPKQELYKHPVS
jgi:hypothetical protein